MKPVQVQVYIMWLRVHKQNGSGERTRRIEKRKKRETKNQELRLIVFFPDWLWRKRKKREKPDGSEMKWSGKKRRERGEERKGKKEQCENLLIYIHTTTWYAYFFITQAQWRFFRSVCLRKKSLIYTSFFSLRIGLQVEECKYSCVYRWVFAGMSLRANSCS